MCRDCEPGQEDPLSIQLSQYQGLSEDEQLQLSLQNMGDTNHILDGEQECFRNKNKCMKSRSKRTLSVVVAKQWRQQSVSLEPLEQVSINLLQKMSLLPTNEYVLVIRKPFMVFTFQNVGSIWRLQVKTLPFAFGMQRRMHSYQHCRAIAKTTSAFVLHGEFECFVCQFLCCMLSLHVSYSFVFRYLCRAPSTWSTTPKATFLASGGADGMVKVWLSTDPTRRNSWECVSTIDHSSFEGKPKNPPLENGQDDIPQIYALQFIEHWQGLATKDSVNKNSFLMTSSDDYIHLWETGACQDKEGDSSQITFSEVFSIRFTAPEGVNNGVAVCNVTSSGLKVPQQKNPLAFSDSNKTEDAFGGFRNPNNTIYVFDASYCPGNGLLGVALSDGTLRLVNGRGVLVSILSLPGHCKSHLTSFSWDSTGSRLASCVANGSLILWNIYHDENAQVSVSCAAVLEGGHVPGRPLFGAQYCGVDDSEDLIVSWGVDGRLCLWDSLSHGQIHAPISTLVSRQDYPIYSVDISSPADKSAILSRLAVGGGGADAGFMGMPLYLYDVERMP